MGCHKHSIISCYWLTGDPRVLRVSFRFMSGRYNKGTANSSLFIVRSSDKKTIVTGDACNQSRNRSNLFGGCLV